MLKRILYLIPVIPLVALLLYSCATTRPKVEEREAITEIVENGVGKEKRFEDALAIAFRDALRKVVLDAIGQEKEKQNSERIKTYMYDIAETYIVRYTVTDKVRLGRDTIVYASVVFDRDKVDESIRTLGVEVPA